jgi:hypothetical protein
MTTYEELRTKIHPDSVYELDDFIKSGWRFENIKRHFSIFYDDFHDSCCDALMQYVCGNFFQNDDFPDTPKMENFISIQKKN